MVEIAGGAETQPRRIVAHGGKRSSANNFAGAPTMIALLLTE